MKSLNKENINRIAFVISVFLFESADLLLLFSLPIFIFYSTHSLLAMGVLISLRPLTRLMAYSFFKQKLQERNFVFLVLIAFSLAFLMIILFNRALSFPVLVLAIIAMGFAREMMNIALIKVEQEKASFTLGKMIMLLRPVIVFAALSIPLFATKPLMEYQFVDIQNYFSVLIAAAAAFFYYSVSKKHSIMKQTILFPKAQSIFSKESIYPDTTIMLMEMIRAFYWVLFPLYIVSNMGQMPELIYLLPAFYLPIFLLYSLKKSFLFKYWKIKPAPKLLLFALVLSGFVFASDQYHLLMITFALGLSIAFIEISTWYEQEVAASYAKTLVSSSLGFLSASLIGTFLNSYFTIPSIFFFLGLMLLGISITNFLKGLKKP
jgi:hypothetical protein